MLAESATKRIGGSVHFVICNSCFWCASLLGTGSFDACPSCFEKAIESLPISRNKRYTFSYNAGAGVVLEFSVDGKRKAPGVQAAQEMSNLAHQNKTSCRACGQMLSVTRICGYCREPVNWECNSCPFVDDSVRIHGQSQGRESILEAELSQSVPRSCKKHPR